MDTIAMFINPNIVGLGPCCNCNQEDLVHAASDGHQYCTSCTTEMIIAESAVYGGNEAPADCSHKRQRRQHYQNGVLPRYAAMQLRTA